MDQNPAEKYLLLRQKNLLFFQKYYPGIFQYISQYQMRHSKLDILPDKNEVDILVDNQHIYNGESSQYAKREVASFLSVYDYGAKIKSFVPLPKGTYKNQRFFARSVSEIYDKYYEVEREFKGYELSNFLPLVVFMGIGLGKHIETLCQIRDIKHAFALETDMDKFSASLFSIDWQEIVEPFLKDPNRSFQFLLLPEERSEQQVYAVLWNTLLTYCPIFPITTLFYNHLGNPSYDRISDQINNDIYVQLFSFGNVDDELNQLNNALHNFRSEIPVLDITNVKDIKAPVCIVGSGPSLDSRIEDLKSLSNDCIIISCGTALRALWKHGIKPDFQVELESDYNTYVVQGVTEDKDFMKSVSLICAAQLNPLTIDLFGDTRLFFKDDGALSDWFSPSHSIIPNSTPTCTNAAIAIAIRLNCSQIFLFGLDYGFPDSENHHASGSVYYKDEIKKKYNLDKKDVMEIPSASGGNIYTTTFLYTAKRRTENVLLTALNSKLVNCSDGAELSNTKWVPKGAALSELVFEHSSLKQQFLNKLFCSSDKALELQNIHSTKDILLGEANNFIRDVSALIELNTLKNEDDFTNLCSTLIPRLSSLEKLDTGMYYFMRGSLWHYLLGGYTHIFTLEEREKEDYLTTWKESILNMLKTLDYRFIETFANTTPPKEDPLVNTTLSEAVIIDLNWEYQNWYVQDGNVYLDQAEVEYAGYDFDGKSYVPGKQ